MIPGKSIIGIVFVLLVIGLVLAIALTSKQSVTKHWKNLQTNLKGGRRRRRKSSHLLDPLPPLPSHPTSQQIRPNPAGHRKGSVTGTLNSKTSNITRAIYDEEIGGDSINNTISTSTPPADHITSVIHDAGIVSNPANNIIITSNPSPGHVTRVTREDFREVENFSEDFDGDIVLDGR
nr:MAG: hypothetical protein [Penaeus monodon endogenous nimavirus]